jgi:hypothetical protein
MEKKAPQWAIDRAEQVAQLSGEKRAVIITNGVIGVHTLGFIKDRKLQDVVLYTSENGE